MKFTDSEIMYCGFCFILFVALIGRMLYEQYQYSKDQKKREQEARAEDRRRPDWLEYRERFERAMRQQCDITSEDWTTETS